MKKDETESFYPASVKHWRIWLQKNHNKKQSVWVVCYKKSANVPTIVWSDAVDEALCFGWIDSVRRSLDDQKFIQFFGRRKPKSVWSKINKAKVERLIAEGRMTEAGLETIDIAKKNGAWTILDQVEMLTIPTDLNKGFKAIPEAKKHFLSLSPSRRKMILQWITMAKRPETRQKRISEVVELAGQLLVPKQFR